MLSSATISNSAYLNRKKKRLGDMLIEENVITSEQLDEALKKQKIEKKKLGTILIEMGFTKEKDIAVAIQKQLGLDFVVLAGLRIREDILRLISDSSILKKHVMMPFAFREDQSNTLYVAMSDPLDYIAQDDMAIITNMEIQPVVATMTDILATIDRYYGSAEAQAVAEQYTRERETQNKTEETVAEVDSNAPIVKLVRTIIEQAVRQRASDIHIEPLETRIRVRYRVDGVLLEIGSYPIDMLAAITTRVKIIGGMDIAEKRRPQDGRITQIVDRMEYDVRVSALPTVFGEKIVMRLTSKMTLSRDKKLLGFSDEELMKFDKMLANPHGIILVTGPTGSGKSTTLYTAVSELNTSEVNIITVEDPVEANIDGVNQVQVNPKADLTFASALRSILRQDPDIIMIGEIRDVETASIAVTASITGHLVVSTVHTNSAASTITRLVDMGIEPYLLADSVVGVIAQRLVRRLCHCKTCRKADTLEKQLLGIPDEEDITIYEPRGCTECNDTGYKGRIGVYEIMPVTNELKRKITKNASIEEIEETALLEGMQTLKMSAARYVLEGVTSIKELRKIVYANDEDVQKGRV
ncbi:MAG: type II secretion system protein GspE [Lachnospiraceae bacterium]|nr:type II secretion system protein GspE [Lachnospiraceae bacterium]